MTEALRRKIIDVIKEKEMDFDEIASKLGLHGKEKRVLRRILADLIRDGIIVKEPDYDRRRHLFKIKNL